MDIFSVAVFLGGLAFFLYGMTVMSGGLEKLAGGKLEKTLKKITSNPFKSMLLGAGITVAIQSSSAMTVMLVGLVNSGIMELGQTIGAIMGSNIGTTMTAWIISLASIDGESIWIQFLKPQNFSPILAFIGIIMVMMSKSNKRKDIGKILIGFSILMYGMVLMSGAVSPLAEIPEFSSILTAFNFPLFGVAVGAIFTGIIQSSSASVGVLQALSLTGSVTYGMALPIIMGQNIGTCITALISSIGVNRNARRVAVVHISFNLIGTAICLTVFYGLNWILNFSFVDSAIGPVGIAFSHSVFNIVTTFILLPFSKKLEILANRIIKDEDVPEEYSFLDERLLKSTSIAIGECEDVTVKMSTIAKVTVLSSIDLLDNYNEKMAEIIAANEDTLDKFEDKLGDYLVQVSRRSLTERDMKRVTKMLHCIGDFERIGDHAVGLMKSAQEVDEKGLAFSPMAQQEIKQMNEAMTEIMNVIMTAYATGNLTMAYRVFQLHTSIDHLISETKMSHIQRLQSGECTIQMGFILSDLLTSCKRVSDHCANIASCVIELS